MNKTVPTVSTYVGCIATFLSHEMAGNNFVHLEAYGLRSKMGLNHGMSVSGGGGSATARRFYIFKTID